MAIKIQNIFQSQDVNNFRPAGYRLEPLNRPEGFSGTPVPLKSFKSIQNLQYGKEFTGYLGVEALGIVCGYLFSYCLFTTVLYYIISFIHKPEPFQNIVIITATITIIGEILRRMTK